MKRDNLLIIVIVAALALMAGAMVYDSHVQASYDAPGTVTEATE